jgi:hypothetical protein
MKHKKSLPVQLDSRFARYALLAGAAVAAAKPAKGSVIVVVEPTPINFTTGTHSLDVNGDGITDFYFSGLSFATGASTSILLTGSGLTFAVFDGLYGIGAGTFFQAEPLTAGYVIQENPSVPFFSSYATMGAFTFPGTLYLGLQFYDTSGMLHYGFAEFDPGQLLGYAYQSAPNTPITTFDVTATPEPGSLELLALGAAGLEVLRRTRARRS